MPSPAPRGPFRAPPGGRRPRHIPRHGTPLDPTGPGWRLVRSGAFTTLAAQICITGHVLGGGELPDLPLVAVLTAVLYGAVSGLARTRRGFWPLLATMAGSQLLFHLALTLNPHGMPAGDPHPVRMWLFHGLAALAGAALLAHGDRLLFALAGWFRRLLPVVTAARAVAGSAGAATGDAVLLPAGADPAAFVRRRGPPGHLACC